MKLSEALKLSLERNVDLIETVPNANPPVTKLISYDKYRYQKDKEQKKERAAQKTAEMKQIQISGKAAQNDLLIKIRQLEKFMNEGHPIEISMRLRGREKYMKDWARLKMNEFLKMISVEYKVISEPKFGGRGMLAQIAKK